MFPYTSKSTKISIIQENTRSSRMSTSKDVNQIPKLKHSISDILSNPAATKRKTTTQHSIVSILNDNDVTTRQDPPATFLNTPIVTSENKQFSRITAPATDVDLSPHPLLSISIGSHYSTISNASYPSFPMNSSVSRILPYQHDQQNMNTARLLPQTQYDQTWSTSTTLDGMISHKLMHPINHNAKEDLSLLRTDYTNQNPRNHGQFEAYSNIYSPLYTSLVNNSTAERIKTSFNDWTKNLDSTPALPLTENDNPAFRLGFSTVSHPMKSKNFGSHIHNTTRFYSGKISCTSSDIPTFSTAGVSPENPFKADLQQVQTPPTRHCAECNRHFTHECSFRRHMLKHKDVKFTCHSCGAKFSRQDSMRRHEKNYHTNA